MSDVEMYFIYEKLFYFRTGYREFSFYFTDYV